MNSNIRNNFRNHSLSFVFLIAILISTTSCSSKPKVIEQVQNSPSDSQPIMEVAQNDESHTVTVKEVLQSPRYTFMNVDEAEKNYWMAIPVQKIEVGAKYIYEGGLLKKNMESKEFNRVFETIYLVSRIRKAQGSSNSNSAVDRAFAQIQQEEGKTMSNSQPKIAGEPVSLTDIFKNPSKYEGKTITVKGKSVKVNNKIMGRNWIHIQDTENSPGLDLAITTSQIIEVGTTALFTGTITLNKDFGAGYKYDIIMENATVE